MWSDLRYAFRGFRRDPGFTAVAVITLALGIGANIGVFSLVRAVLLQPLPVADADRVVDIAEQRPSSSRAARLPVSAHEFVAWKQQNQTFERLSLQQPMSMNLTGSGDPEALMVIHVSADYFPLLGLQPARGRVFSHGEDRAGADAVILSDALWHRRFNGDPRVLGRRIFLNDQPFVVVGVMPPLPRSLSPGAWVPIDVAGNARAVGRHNLTVLGRLEPGVSLEQARSDLEMISARLAREMPAANTDHHASLLPLRESLVGDYRRGLVLLLIAVAFVLLIACANVANLLLARTANRQREIAIRTAIGASRLRVLRQLIVESVALALAGGFAGLLVALWIVELASAMTAVRIPLLETSTLDWPVFVVAFAVSLAAGIAAGLVPALRGAQAQAGSLRETRGTTDIRGARVRSVLVASEVALTLVLLVGAGLLTHSFVRLLRVDAGFASDSVVVAPIDLPASRYREAHQRRAFVEQLTERLLSKPGVEAVGATTNLPLGGTDNWMPFRIHGRPAPAPGQDLHAAFRVVTTGYFPALRIPLKTGRLFSDADARRAVPFIRWFPQQRNPSGFDEPQPPPVAVVSETAARQFWPGQNPVGQRINVLYSPDVTIVGIVGDIKHNALSLPATPHIYLSHNQEPWGSLSFVIRTTGDRSLATTVVREQVRALDASLPLSISAMDDVRAASIGEPRFYVLVVGAFGAVALGLAVVGIFGVVSYVAAQRTREIGIRVALGAQRGEILGLVVGRGMRPIAVGIAAGTIGALLLTRSMETLLYEVRPSDPLTLGASVALLAGVALAACWIPARRAAGVDPVIALRAE